MVQSLVVLAPEQTETTPKTTVAPVAKLVLARIPPAGPTVTAKTVLGTSTLAIAAVVQSLVLLAPEQTETTPKATVAHVASKVICTRTIQ